MAFRLPSLSSLRAFEAAARHQSFKLAAAELNVTPSAVSHGIVGLEQALGVVLFVREPGKLLLTPEGAHYLSYIAEAITLIATGTQRLQKKRTRCVITVSCAPTLASRWLMPRLHNFSDQWPNVSVTVDTSRRKVGFPADGFDFAIRMSRAADARPAWSRLFGEQLAPVCSAAYRATLVDQDGCIDLRQATLIHVTSASEDWQAWLDRRGIDGIDPTGGLRFDTIQLAFEAAAMGLGVALGRWPLVNRDLATQALVEVSPDAITAETAYWLVSAESADQRPDLVGFKRWVIGEAEAFERSATACGQQDR